MMILHSNQLWKAQLSFSGLGAYRWSAERAESTMISGIIVGRDSAIE
jgi:hypothetical protein